MNKFHVCKLCGREWKFKDCTEKQCSRGYYGSPCPKCHTALPEGRRQWPLKANSVWNYVEDPLEAFVREERKKAGIVDDYS